MSFDTFTGDPKSYLKTHQVRISQNAHVLASLAAGAAVPVPGGGTSRLYTHNGTNPYTTGVAFMNAPAIAAKARGMKPLNAFARNIGIGAKLLRQFDGAASAADVGLRWLPYEPGYVTYMVIDGGATFALTGELSGCTVGVGSVGGAIYYFHSFAPTGHHGPAARTIQRAMIDHVGTTLGIHNMCYAENTIDYDGFAFSFGKLKNNTWKFYAYGTQSGVYKMGEF